MIQSIPHPVSEGLRQENEVHRCLAAKHDAERLRFEHPTVGSFLQRFLSRAEGLQFAAAMAEVEPGSRVLDIGAGTGRTSIYLASRGCRVSVVEPSPDLCRFIETAARLYDLALDVYHVCAECIDRLPVRDFDACVFNASFHHCDEPARALANCHAVLVPGGKLFLLNEPVLQCFRSKAWFHRQLEEGTLVTGHYGGNEHTYYRHEYLFLLREAGFADIRDRLSLRYLKPERYLRRLERRGVPRGEVLSRQLYYGLVRLLGRAGPVGSPALGLLKKLSLVQTYFVAAKAAA